MKFKAAKNRSDAEPEIELPDGFGDMSEFDRMLADSGPFEPFLTARDLEGFDEETIQEIKAELIGEADSASPRGAAGETRSGKS
jgi:hypothetical protein